MSELWNTIQEVYLAVRGGAMPDVGIWSYIVLAWMVAVEGPLSTLLAAAAAAAGMAELRWVLLATVLGNIIGDCAWYLAGYMGKAEQLKRYGRYIGIRPVHVERLEGGMQTHTAKLLVISKLAYGLIIPTMVAAGVARVPFRRWFPVVVVMETLWSLALIYVGYRATWLLVEFERGLRTVGIVTVLFLAGGIGYFFYRRHLAGQQQKVRAAYVRSESPVTSGLGVRSSAMQGIVVADAPSDSVAHGARMPISAAARPKIAPGKIVPGLGHSRLTRALPKMTTAVFNSATPMPLMGEAISVRLMESFQAWDGVSVAPAVRWEAEPVEGSG